MFGQKKSKIKLLGRSGLIFKENGKSMFIDSEMILTKDDFDMVVYTDSIERWDPPYEQETLSGETRTEIMNSIQRQMKRCKIQWEKNRDGTC